LITSSGINAYKDVCMYRKLL